MGYLSGQAAEPCFQFRMFLGLDQSEMPRREGRDGITAETAHKRITLAGERLAQQRPVLVATNPVGDNASH